jgi:hypothetical protein
MAAPARRFALAAAELTAPVALLAADEPGMPASALRSFSRRVSATGRISFEDQAYHIGVWLAGETVELALRDGLIEVSHRGVLIACHARRQRRGSQRSPHLRPPKARPARPQTSGRPVVRKVDRSGAVSFAGTNYRGGNGHRFERVEVRVVGDTVEISQAGRIIKTHAARHDRSKEHGAFATPGGRPRRSNAASLDRSRTVTQVLEPKWNAGTGT